LCARRLIVSFEPSSAVNGDNDAGDRGRRVEQREPDDVGDLFWACSDPSWWKTSIGDDVRVER
jgi:hypothetical protein